MPKPLTPQQKRRYKLNKLVKRHLKLKARQRIIFLPNDYTLSGKLKDYVNELETKHKYQIQYEFSIQ